MTTSTPPDNTVLALSPPFINGQTTPVEGARVGVPLVAYDLVTDGEGAVLPIDPPPAGTMDPGDVMELWLEGEPAALDSETIVDPNVRTTLRIPKGRLHPDKVNKLYYTVRRGSSNIGTSEPLLEILYNRIRPGLKDRLTDPGGHSELKLLLPDAIKNGVGADFVSAEVCVAYPYCRAYDLITLKCNGELLEPKPKVNPNQAPQPPNPGDENPITICFTITRAFLDKAKRQDKKLHFSYTVTDQIGNGPDTDAPWSPVQSVDEDLDGTLLDKPILREVEGDSTDDPGTIDLEKLAGNPLLVVVLTVADKRFQVGDKITALYTASRVGLPDITQTVDGIVEADEFGEKKRCTLKVDNANVVADSVVKVTYELFRSTDDFVGNSSIATATVKGAFKELQTPRVKEAPNNILHPIAAKDMLTVVVPAYDNMIGSKVSVTWSGTLGEGSKTEGPVDVTVEADKEVVLPNSLVAFNMGKPVKVTYTAIRNGASQNSSELALTVLSIAEGDSRLPAPVIDGAVGNELDAFQLAEIAQLRIIKWPLQSLYQCIWLRYDGFDKDGNAVEKILLAGDVHQQAEGLVTPAQVSWLRELMDGSTLTITFKVNFDKVANADSAVGFPTRTYTIRSVKLVSGHEHWETEHAQNFTKNKPVTFKSTLTFNLLAGADFSAIRTTDNNTMLFLKKDSRGKFSLAGVARKIEFTYHNAHSANEISFFDEKGSLIETKALPITDNRHLQFIFNSTAGQYISHFEVNTNGEAGGGVYFDNIMWN